jgi:hypothetical protein
MVTRHGARRRSLRRRVLDFRAVSAYSPAIFFKAGSFSK